jgi:CheY-like chemotaxis protein
MNGTILLVEDEDDLRSNIARTLRDRGYTVDEAGDGEEGLERILAAVTDYAVVVCDLAMPILDGLEMLRAAGDRLGGARVLLLSAYALSDSPPALAGRAITALPKPVSHARVAQEIETLMAA